MTRALFATCVLATTAIAAEAAALTVEEAVSNGCSTKQVEGLSLQIIAEGNCVVPGAYEELPPRPNVNLGSAVLPYLELPARDALVLALDENPGTSMQINSMLRTVAQQYLLYRWYQLGACGIGLAATPGNSNHETGLAIDIQQYNTWRPILESHGFSWLGSSDPVHFDYVGPGAVDHKGVDVLAFQQLWNRNHPDDLIAEDGIYGPQTEGRLKQSPAEGFAMGAECMPTMEGPIVLAARFVDAEDVFDDGPSAGAFDLFAGESYAFEIEVRNEGDPTDVTLAMVLPSALAAEGYLLESDAGGSFAAIDPSAGDPAPDQPLPASFELSLAALESGETRRVTLDLVAVEYSVEGLEPLALAMSAADTSLEILADVYSGTRWEWNGERREGWTGGDGVTADAATTGGLLVLESTGEPLIATSPVLALASADILGVSLRLARSGGDDSSAALVFEIDGQPVERALSVPADGEMHELSVSAEELALPPGVVESVSVAAFEGAVEATVSLDYLRIESIDGAVPPGGIAGENACGCRVAAPRRWHAGLLGLALVGLGLGLRRRRR